MYLKERGEISQTITTTTTTVHNLKCSGEETDVMECQAHLGLRGKMATMETGEKLDPMVHRVPQAPGVGEQCTSVWGRTDCSSEPGTQRLYEGIAAGSRWDVKGGASEYLCLPKTPKYSSYHPGVQPDSPLYGVELQLQNGSPYSGKHEHNVPCALCFAVGRSAAFTQPASTDCPRGWTTEYTGYMMTERQNHNRDSVVCLDKDLESVPGSAASTDPATFYHMNANCNGLPCPPYDPEKELTCAVCTI